MAIHWWQHLITIGGILAAVGALVGGTLYVAAPHPPKTPTKIAMLAEMEHFLEQLVTSGEPPSLAVVVVKDGRIVYNRAFGLADGPKQLAATSATVYHWWSMTKIITAIAILQLHEQGKLQLAEGIRLQHDSGGPGFATTMRLYPAKGLGIALLANGTDLDRDGITDRLAHLDWAAQ